MTVTWYEGYESYDMLEGDIKTIGDYKKSFGTTVYPVLYAEKSFNYWIRFARDVYARMKKARKKVAYLLNSGNSNGKEDLHEGRPLP